MSTLTKTKNKIESFFDERVIYEIQETKFNNNFRFVSSEELTYGMFLFEVINMNNRKSGIVKYARSLGMYLNKNLNAYFGVAETKDNSYVLIEISDDITTYLNGLQAEEEKFDFVVDTFFHDLEKEIISDSCVICLTNKPTQYFTSCGHRCTCEKCANRLEKKFEIIKCPLCRKIN